jgi:hypothetical protein
MSPVINSLRPTSLKMPNGIWTRFASSQHNAFIQVLMINRVLLHNFYENFMTWAEMSSRFWGKKPVKKPPFVLEYQFMRPQRREGDLI